MRRWRIFGLDYAGFPTLGQWGEKESARET